MFSEDPEGDSLVEFPAWKWKVLQRRREFFVPQLAAFNLFLWLYMSVAIFKHGGVSVATKGVVFTCAQGSVLLVLALLFTPRSKSVLKGSFGYRVCILLGLSIFPFIYSVKQFAQTDLYFSDTNGGIAAAFVSAAWITSIHHVGLTEVFTWTMAIAVMLMWCFYMDGRGHELNAPAYVAIVVSCLVMSFCGSLVEAEYKDIYALQNEAVEKSLNDVTFVEDVASVLRHMGKMLQRLGAGAGKAPPELVHTEYLCSSLFGAATQSTMEENGSISARSEVELTKLCAQAINKMERVKGRACTTYYDPGSAEVCINSKKFFLELIFLLLCEDTTSVKSPPSFCLFSFQSVNSNLHIMIKRTSAEVQATASDKVGDSGDSTDDTADSILEEAFLQTLVAEKTQLHGVYDNARFRLADRIARKHLKSKVDMTTPESHHGLVSTTLRLVIPGPVSMPNISREEQRISGDPNFFYLNPWYVVEYYKSTEDKLANIKYQLDMLAVPWKSVHAYHFSNMKAKTQIAVVHELWFRSHKEKVFEEVYSLAQAVILVSSESDAPKIFQYAPNEGPARVVKVSASISTRDLFNAIQSLVAKLKPMNLDVSATPPLLPAPNAAIQRQASDLSLGHTSGDLGRGGALRVAGSLDIVPPPRGSEREMGRRTSEKTFSGFLPLLLESEDEADQQLEDSVLHTRMRSMGPPSRPASGRVSTTPTPSGRDGNTSGQFDGSNSDEFEEEIGRSTSFAPEDPSFNVVKQKWTLLLDRLEFEVFVNRPSVVIQSLQGTSDDTGGTVEKNVSELYHRAVDRVNASVLGSYDIVAKNLIEILRKQRTSKDRHWTFACLPYQQRVAKLIADEFVLPLGDIRRLVKEGDCENVAELLTKLECKCDNMKMYPLSDWFAVCTDVVRLLVEHYPAAEPFTMTGGSGGDISSVAAPSRPSTGRSHPSTDSGTFVSGMSVKADSMLSGGTAVRSTATAIIPEEAPLGPNAEIRKILCSMFDLIEVNAWTLLANVMRLCDEDL